MCINICVYIYIEREREREREREIERKREREREVFWGRGVPGESGGGGYRGGAGY